MKPPEEMVALAVAAGTASPCAKSKRGVVLRWPGGTMMIGNNRPAIGTCDGSEACRRDCGKICVHAEQIAILEAPRPPWGAEMLHVKVVDGTAIEGGPPSCVECSKLILAAGITGMWLLETGRGWVRRTAEEFHRQTLANLSLHVGATNG